MKKTIIRTAICIMMICLAAALAGCASGAGNSRTADMKSYEELNDPSVKLGCINGSISGPMAEEQLPEA